MYGAPRESRISFYVILLNLPLNLPSNLDTLCKIFLSDFSSFFSYTTRNFYDHLTAQTFLLVRNVTHAGVQSDVGSWSQTVDDALTDCPCYVLVNGLSNEYGQTIIMRKCAASFS